MELFRCQEEALKWIIIKNKLISTQIVQLMMQLMFFLWSLTVLQNPDQLWLLRLVNLIIRILINQTLNLKLEKILMMQFLELHMEPEDQDFLLRDLKETQEIFLVTFYNNFNFKISPLKESLFLLQVLNLIKNSSTQFLINFLTFLLHPEALLKPEKPLNIKEEKSEI